MIYGLSADHQKIGMATGYNYLCTVVHAFGCSSLLSPWGTVEMAAITVSLPYFLISFYFEELFWRMMTLNCHFFPLMVYLYFIVRAEISLILVPQERYGALLRNLQWSKSWHSAPIMTDRVKSSNKTIFYCGLLHFFKIKSCILRLSENMSSVTSVQFLRQNSM